MVSPSHQDDKKVTVLKFIMILFVASLGFLSSKEMSDTVETMASESARFLQSESGGMGRRGTIVRLVLYALALIMCFVVPFYLRDVCSDRQLRERDHDMEDATTAEDAPGATTGRASVSAEAQSETRARRKEYRAERRARIVQVFSPVSMVSLFAIIHLRKIQGFVRAHCFLLFFPPTRFSKKNIFIAVKMKSNEQKK